MSADLKLLGAGFLELLNSVLFKCEEQGIKMIPFFTLRDPWKQAKLWRQSRPFIQIQRMVDMLKEKEAPWLAEILLSVGPQYGRWATNALPGASWHQWAEAVDCFVMESGKAIWNSNHMGYRIYGKEAVLLGLESGHYWEQRDSCHLQKRKERVAVAHSWAEIERQMKAVFGEKEEEVVLTDVMANFI